MLNDDITNTVLGIVEETCGEKVSNLDILLSDIGVDSVQTIKLVLTIEAHFELEIPDEQFSADAFESVSNIVKMIKKLKN